MSQQQHFAFLSQSPPLVIPAGAPEDRHDDHVPQQASTSQRAAGVRSELTDIYQLYAERYPNPRLVEEYQERDQLLQAASAATRAQYHHDQHRGQQQAKKRKGWFGFLFGGSSDNDQEALPRESADDNEEDSLLVYTDRPKSETNDGGLCDTLQLLDVACIPQEAHSVARFHLASQRTRQDRPNIVRSETNDFHSSTSTLMVLVGLGVIAEFHVDPQQQATPDDARQPQQERVHLTADRVDLLEYARTHTFCLCYARAVSIGPNFLAASWGFDDGVVVFYRRIDLSSDHTRRRRPTTTTTIEEQPAVAWEPIVFLGPSKPILDHSFDIGGMMGDDDADFNDDDNSSASALLRVTDMVSMVVSTSGLPAAALALSRLGGYMEVLPLPPSIWYGPVLTSDKHKPRTKNRRKKGPPQHYAKGHLVNVASDQAPVPILALTTYEYHSDVLCLEAIRTRVGMETTWNQGLYPNAPPAEYVVVASGTHNGHEVITFWALCYLFVDDPALQQSNGSAGFTLHAVLQEAMDVGQMGANVSVFANKAILKHWRLPRQVALRADTVKYDITSAAAMEGELTGAPTSSSMAFYKRVTALTTSAPIVAMTCIVVQKRAGEDDNADDDPAGSLTAMLALLDWNGCVTLMDCSLLERVVSQSLSPELYELIFLNDENGVATNDDNQNTAKKATTTALVKTLAARSQVAKAIMAASSPASTVPFAPVVCVNVKWLERGDDMEGPLLILLTTCASQDNRKNGRTRVFILSGMNASDLLLSRSSSADITRHRHVFAPSVFAAPFPTDWATMDCVAGQLMIAYQLQLKSSSTQPQTLSLCAMKPLSPQDIISSLARDAKYEQALEAAQQLPQHEQSRLKDLLGQCQRKLWETSPKGPKSIEFLSQIKDDAYVVKQALSLFDTDDENAVFDVDASNQQLESMDVDRCHAICVLALKRVESATLASALALGGIEGKHVVLQRLRGIIVRLGTFRLLCKSLGAAPTFDRFCRGFVDASLLDLALRFAAAADVSSLSIIWFRHRIELQSHQVQIVDLIALTLPPRVYSHLLPVHLDYTPQRDGNEHDVFLTGIPPDDGRPLAHLLQIPLYVKDAMDIYLVLDADDEKMVLEHNSAISSAENVDELGDWYLARATKLQLFVGNLHHIVDFCVLALHALGTSTEDFNADAAAARPAIHKLYAIWGCASSLQRMLFESLDGDEGPGDLFDLSPFATVSPDDLRSMEMEEVVKVVLGGQEEEDAVSEIYRDHLLPLLKFFPEEKGNELDNAIKAYCIDMVRTSSIPPMELDMSIEDESEIEVAIALAGAFGYEEEGRLLSAMRICSAIASASRTSKRKSERIIRDKRVLMDLVLSILYEVSLRCENASVPDAICRTVVEIMWTLYESLPCRMLNDEENSDQDLAQLSRRVDFVYKDLVGVDLISQWPGCWGSAFSFLVQRTRLREDLAEAEQGLANSGVIIATAQEKLLSIGRESLTALCRSFCGQAASQKGSVGLPGLVRDLLSDAEQLSKACYDKEAGFDAVLSPTLSSELIGPLLQQHEFELIFQIFTGADESWWDKDKEARSIRAFIDEVVFAESTSAVLSRHSVDDAISCQDILSPVFPELQGGFISVRRSLEAAKFMNTVIFADQTMKLIQPADLRGDSPLDVVESVLKAFPGSILIGCKEWGEPHIAFHGNKALRDYHALLSPSKDQPPGKNVPPLPGGAVFHLAGLLGLDDHASVLAVKSRVVHYGVSAHIFGAAAAVCRTLIHDENSFSGEQDSLVRMSSIAQVVTSEGFDDVDTKRELCVGALQRYSGDVSVDRSDAFYAILQTLAMLEPRTCQAQFRRDKPQIIDIPPPVDSMECLYKHTWAQYSVNIFELFGTLQQQASNCIVDDSLLNALSRYVLFCCIFRCTRPLPLRSSGGFERSATNDLLALGSALMLHIQKTAQISKPAVEELCKVLMNQAMRAMKSNPLSVEDFAVLPDEAIVRQLLGRGFTQMGARRAALATKNIGIARALQWGVANASNTQLNHPIVRVCSERTAFVDKLTIQDVKNAFVLASEFLIEGTRSVEEWMFENRGGATAGGAQVSIDQSSAPVTQPEIMVPSEENPRHQPPPPPSPIRPQGKSDQPTPRVPVCATATPTSSLPPKAPTLSQSKSTQSTQPFPRTIKPLDGANMSASTAPAASAKLPRRPDSPRDLKEEPAEPGPTANLNTATNACATSQAPLLTTNYGLKVSASHADPWLLPTSRTQIKAPPVSAATVTLPMQAPLPSTTKEASTLSAARQLEPTPQTHTKELHVLTIDHKLPTKPTAQLSIMTHNGKTMPVDTSANTASVASPLPASLPPTISAPKPSTSPSTPHHHMKAPPKVPPTSQNEQCILNSEQALGAFASPPKSHFPVSSNSISPATRPVISPENRDDFRKRGAIALSALRTAAPAKARSSQDGDDRRRLIEAGRLLLAKSRATAGLPRPKPPTPPTRANTVLLPQIRAQPIIVAPLPSTSASPWASMIKKTSSSEGNSPPGDNGPPIHQQNVSAHSQVHLSTASTREVMSPSSNSMKHGTVTQHVTTKLDVADNEDGWDFDENGVDTTATSTAPISVPPPPPPPLPPPMLLAQIVSPPPPPPPPPPPMSQQQHLATKLDVSDDEGGWDDFDENEVETEATTTAPAPVPPLMLQQLHQNVAFPAPISREHDNSSQQVTTRSDIPNIATVPSPPLNSVEDEWGDDNLDELIGDDNEEMILDQPNAVNGWGDDVLHDLSGAGVDISIPENAASTTDQEAFGLLNVGVSNNFGVRYPVTTSVDGWGDDGLGDLSGRLGDADVDVNGNSPSEQQVTDAERAEEVDGGDWDFDESDLGLTDDAAVNTACSGAATENGNEWDFNDQQQTDSDAHDISQSNPPDAQNNDGSGWDFDDF